MLRLTADIITDRLPMKGAGDVVQVDSAFADHLLSLGVAVEIKVDAPIQREPMQTEKKTLTESSPPGLASPERIVKKRGRPAKRSLP